MATTTAMHDTEILAAMSHRVHLVPVDETPASERVLNWLLDNMYREGDVVHLYRVIQPHQYTVFGGDLTAMPQVQEESPEAQKALEEAARNYIAQHFELKLMAKKIQYSTELALLPTDNDTIGAAICKRAETLGAATVVMARHGKHPAVEFFVGSVTNYCAHHSKVPVVVLHVD